jgi:Cdc6-like AAA superfamily ATPase
MTIRGFNEAELSEVLSNYLSPSQEIKSPERLIGRERSIQAIRRALLSPGRHIFIYGDRGVGKTSLAVTAGQLCVAENKNFIYIPCSQDTSFYDVIWSAGRCVLEVDATRRKSGGFTFGVSVATVGGFNFSRAAGEERIDRPTSFSECLSVLRFLRSQLIGQIIIAIDEIDRITSATEKARFAELLKNIGSVVEDVRLIYCGIGADVDELIGSHLSVGRMFEPIEVEKLSHDSLWKIIENVVGLLTVTIPRGMLLRIGIISDGFPHYVHLIGECLFYAMHDDAETVADCSDSHFSAALKAALNKAEP